jgi:hypothetical protein
MPAIPAIWEVEIGRLMIQAGLGKNMTPYLKNY